MKVLQTALVLMGTFVFAPQSFADEMDILFGNTIVLTTITPEVKTTIQLYYNADGTVGTDTGDVYSWVKRGASVCTTFKLQDGSDYETCTPLS